MSEAQPCVIVIEDDPLVRTGQRMLLEHAGYRVIEIGQPSDLEHFKAVAGPRDAIIADFDLGPGLTGVEVAEAIMQQTGRRIPTLVLSASFGSRSGPAATTGDMPMMFKPATEEKLLAWVAEATGSQRNDLGRS